MPARLRPRRWKRSYDGTGGCRRATIFLGGRLTVGGSSQPGLGWAGKVWMGGTG